MIELAGGRYNFVLRAIFSGDRFTIYYLQYPYIKMQKELQYVHTL